MAGVEQILEEFNRLKTACQEMEQKKIVVGIVGGGTEVTSGGPSKATSEVLAIAHAHEYGATIKPKNKKYLAIPLTKEAEAAGSPTVFSDLRFVHAKGGNLLMVRDKKKGRGKGETESEALFLLVKSVTLPERSFIRASFDAEQDKIESIMANAVEKVLKGDITPDAAAESIGAQSAQLVQNYIDENKVTPKSKFSKKQIHTTLYETGTHIRDRISWKVEKK